MLFLITRLLKKTNDRATHKERQRELRELWEPGPGGDVLVPELRLGNFQLLRLRRFDHEGIDRS